MNETSGFTMPSKTYDVLKYIALVVLPALATLYFGLAQIWNFPAGEEVVGTISLVDVFLGILINRSSKNYNNFAYTPDSVVGELIVTQDPEGMVDGMKLVANRDPLVLPDQEYVIFDIKREPS